MPLRTLANPGDLAPLASPPPWSFHLGLGTLLGPPSVCLLANGMLFSFPQSDPDAYVDILTVAPGVVVGHTQVRVNPSLFCPESEMVEEPGSVSVEVAGQAIVLLTRQQEDTTHFCLAVAKGGLDAARAAAAEGLDYALQQQVEKEVELRKAFWNRHGRTGRDQRTLNHAIERLIYLLEPASGEIAGWWVRTGASGFSLRWLQGLVRTWLDADAEVAMRLVRTVLDALPSSGALPSALHPASGAQVEQSTWPMLTSCVWSLGKAPGAPAFTAEALPKLRDYLTWALSYFDPQGRGTPVWGHARESLTPDTFDSKLCSAGLAGLLLHEIDLFFQMLDQHSELELDTAAISLGREHIEEHLLDSLWDAEAGVFRDHYIGGEPVTRITLSGILPLLWPGLEAKHRGALLPHLQEKGTLHRRSGWASWQAWEEDLAAAPVLCEHQILLFDRVRELHHATAVQMGGQIAEALGHALAERGTLPSLLNQAESSDEANPEEASEIPGACLYVLCSTPLLEKHAESVTKLASTLDKHRTLVAATCMGALLLLLGGQTFHLWRGGELDHEASVAAFGLTEQLIAARQFDKARQSLAGLEGRARQESIDFYSGMIAFHQGNFAEAENLFQSAADAGWRDAESRMNLALSVFRQGKLEEAARIYEAIVQQFDERNPQLAQLARAAGNIIRENEHTLTQSLGEP